MAAWRSELHNVDAVMNFYEQHEDAAMFRIYAGNKPEAAYCRFEFYGDNKQDGARVLYENLQALKLNTANTNQYLLQVIKKIKATTTKQKPTEFFQVTFQLNGVDLPLPMVGNYNAGNDVLMQKLIESNEKNNQLLQLLLAKQVEEEEEEEEEQPHFLNGLLQNEQIQTMLIGALQNVLMPKNKGIAGITETNENTEIALHEAIERLKAKNPNLHIHLTKLADIAEKDEATFNYLLNMLKKM